MTISSAKKHRIFARDGWRCQYCGIPINEDSASVDHIKPKIDGGNNSDENLRACCKVCNSTKNGRSVDWLRKHYGLRCTPYAGIINVQTYEALVEAGAVLQPIPSIKFAFEA